MLFGEAGAYLAAWMPDCPRDTSDVGRCVELLDLAEANGQAWRERIDELAEPFPESWGKLTGYWPRIEAAFRRDVAAQSKRRWISVTASRPRGATSPPVRMA